MLPPEYLNHAPESLVALIRQLEDDILKDAARRIGKAGNITDTAQWQLWRLEQLGQMRESAVRQLAKYAGATDDALRKVLLDSGTATLASDDAIYRGAGLEPSPIGSSPQLNNLLDAGYRQTAGTWQNLTATTANTVTGELEAALDDAWAQVSSGAFDYKTAVKRAVDGLADRMAGVTYPTGHKDTLEVAVRRAVLTGVNQTAGKLQMARAEELGSEFFEVTAHAGARPEHAAWQGKVFHKGGAVDRDGIHYEDFEQATGYGTGGGLCGWNCRHSFFPFFPGLSDPAYSQQTLDAYNARDIEYNGKQYTRYELEQMQRALEREVRKHKRRYLAETEAGLDGTQEAVKLKASRERLTQFTSELAQKGFVLDSSRAGVSGFGRSAASRAVWDARKSLISSQPHGTIGTGGNASTVSIPPQPVLDALRGTNPGYSSGEASYRYNCQRCVVAYELRRRGLDVVAKPLPYGPSRIVWGTELFVSQDGKKPIFKRNQPATMVQHKMSQAPDGARFFVFLQWKNGAGTGGAHVFVAEKAGKTVFYVDPQTGEHDASSYFAIGRRFGYLRVDNLELASDQSLIREAVKEEML